MKIVLVILMSIVLVNCGDKKFNVDDANEILDLIEDKFPVDPVDPIDPIDPVDPVDPYCPRYDLVIKSSHVSTKRLSYKFSFNGEMAHKSTQGEIHIEFLEDGAKKLTECSGDYTNTAHYTNLKPLKAVEQITSMIVINHSVSCLTVMPSRMTSLQVIDAANGKVLWDEQRIRNRIGDCAFGYTEEGQQIRNQLIGFADKITKDVADSCTAN